MWVNMNLMEIITDRLLKVSAINAGGDAGLKLKNIGVSIGDCLYKLNEKNGGPVIVMKQGPSSARLIIGKGLARKIIVSYN
jgi:Fe2+ transport system protein FeoA